MTPQRHISLSELSSTIKSVISSSFHNLSFWVVADVSNHSFKADKGYHYFKLVEKDNYSNNITAQFDAKAWGSGSQNISNFEFATGQKFRSNIQVLVKVTVEYHPTFGLQLQVVDIDTTFTLGVIEQQRQSTLLKLINENPSYIQKIGEDYITRNKKLPLRNVIQKVAVISATGSAGLQDFKHSLLHNTFNYRFIIHEYFTGVQGDANAESMKNKLLEIFYSKIDYDAVILTRGGGSETDFLIYDNYNVCQAIAKFPIPVITGIGHHKNVTIADLMSNTQTKTPTKAAEFIIAHNRAFEDSILEIQKSILVKTQQLFSSNFKLLSSMNSGIVNNARSSINHYKDSLVEFNQIIVNNSKSILFHQRKMLVSTSAEILTKPKIILYNRINDLKNWGHTIKVFSGTLLKNQKGYLGHYVSVVKLMAPENLLQKGFAIIKYKDKVISKSDKLTEGSNIDILFNEYQLKAIIKQKSKYDGKEFNL